MARPPTTAAALTGGDRLVTGFDPTDKGFYHGGDIAGLIAKLDYLRPVGHHRHLDDAPLQKQDRARRGGQCLRRLSRLLDHRLYPA